MKEADEYQHIVLKRSLMVVLLTIMIMIAVANRSVMANEMVIKPVEFTSSSRVELPQEKRHQFRAKLLRNWWPVKQPKYTIYRSLFQKS